jgi:hypothetical protein
MFIFELQTQNVYFILLVAKLGCIPIFAPFLAGQYAI